MTEFLAGGAAVLIAAAFWFWSRVRNANNAIPAAVAPSESIGSKTARAAIIGTRDDRTEAIQDDLESDDPAGRLASRANRNRERRK